MNNTMNNQTQEKPTVVPETFNLSTIRVPKEFGMFSSAGNRSLELKSQTLIKSLSKIKIRSSDRQVECVKAFTKYFKSWKQMSKSKHMKECTDTEVRNCVRDFAETCAKIVRTPKEMIDVIYEDAYWNT